jgi:uncharacterized membrane protein
MSNIAEKGKILFDINVINRIALGKENFFFNPKDSSYLYLLPSLLVKKISILFKIMQHRDIFIFNFKTQLAIN